MGAWGHGSFENDDALDWVYALEADGVEAIRSALAAVLEADGYVEAPEASMALAAAEVVAALRLRPAADLPEEVTAWVAAHAALDPMAVGDLARLADGAVARVLAPEDSELYELWYEGGDDVGDPWRQTLTALRERLA